MFFNQNSIENSVRKHISDKLLSYFNEGKRKMTIAEQELIKLADFIVLNFPQEFTANKLESAVDVAIRLLSTK